MQIKETHYTGPCTTLYIVQPYYITSLLQPCYNLATVSNASLLQPCYNLVTTLHVLQGCSNLVTRW